MTNQEDSQVASACGAALASSCEVMVKVQDSMNTILESVQVTNLQTQIAQKETRLELLKLQLAVQQNKVQCSPVQCQSSEKAPAVPEQLSAKRKRTKPKNKCRYFQVCNFTCLINVPPQG